MFILPQHVTVSGWYSKSLIGPQTSIAGRLSPNFEGTIRRVAIRRLRTYNISRGQLAHSRLTEGSQANNDDIDLGGEPADDSDMNLNVV